jgi:hypothetical protein
VNLSTVSFVFIFLFPRHAHCPADVSQSASTNSILAIDEQPFVGHAKQASVEPPGADIEYTAAGATIVFWLCVRRQVPAAVASVMRGR